MTGDLSKLSAALKELAAEPAPPMDLDVARARKLGRRTLTRRRTVNWLGGVMAVALVAGLITSAVPRSGQVPDSPIPPSSTVIPPSSTAAPPEPPPNPPPSTVIPPETYGHPLITHASFGWLPDWFVGVGYLVGYGRHRAHAKGTGDLGPIILLNVLPYSNAPSWAEFKVPAEPVNGRTAYWLAQNPSDPTNGGTFYLLRWQAPTGQWAEMHAYYMPVNDARDVLLRIAAEVTVADRPVPVPLRITNLPAGFVPDAVGLDRPPIYSTGAWEFVLNYQVNGQGVGIRAYPAGTGLPLPGGGGETCTTADGIDVCVSVSADLTAIGGPRGLLERITVLGMDERNWTTSMSG